MDFVGAADCRRQLGWILLGLPIAVVSSDGFRPGCRASAVTTRTYSHLLSGRRGVSDLLGLDIDGLAAGVAPAAGGLLEAAEAKQGDEARHATGDDAAADQGAE